MRREDKEMRRTGIIQSGRQVFELAREYFGLDRGPAPPFGPGLTSHTQDDEGESGTGDVDGVSGPLQRA